MQIKAACPMYYTAVADGSGKPLTGAKRYIA